MYELLVVLVLYFVYKSLKKTAEKRKEFERKSKRTNRFPKEKQYPEVNRTSASTTTADKTAAAEFKADEKQFKNSRGIEVRKKQHSMKEKHFPHKEKKGAAGRAATAKKDFRKKELIKGIVYSQVLSPPRSISPWTTPVNRRKNGIF